MAAQRSTGTDNNLVGLARVSTGGQDVQLQCNALTEAGCARIFEEKISTRVADRPGLTGTLAGSYHPTGEGKFFFTMMAAFAELERHMNHQRTMAGLAAARAKGRTGGRPTVGPADYPRPHTGQNGPPTKVTSPAVTSATPVRPRRPPKRTTSRTR